MSFRKRLIIAFSGMGVVVLILGLFAVSTIHILRSYYNNYDLSRKAAENSTDIAETLNDLKSSIDDRVMGIRTQGTGFQKLQQKLKKQLEMWNELSSDPDAKKDFEIYELRLRNLSNNFDQVSSLIKSGNKESVIDTMLDTVLPELKSTTDFVKLFTNSELNNAEILAIRIKRTTNVATYMAWGLILATFLMGLALSFQLYYSIAEPMDILQEGIKRFGQGEWNLEFQHFEVPEIETLAKTMENMAKSLKSLQTKVVQMDRMSAVGTLAGGVAHELNNPLTGVLGVAQILLDKMDKEDSKRVMAEKIYESAKRCQGIVHSLLNFSRQAEIMLIPTNAHEVINQALVFCQADINSRGIEVIYTESKNLAQIQASAQHILQVFLNMITNAMDAMKNGGKITIAAWEQPSNSPLLSNENFKAGAISISFTDTGVGISPDHIAKVFEPFFTTKDVGKGTGLGLSVSYSIIKKHNGIIEVSSEGIGKGTTFTITLPKSTDESVKKLKDQAETLANQNNPTNATRYP